MNPLRQIRSRISITVLSQPRFRVPRLRSMLLLLCFATALSLAAHITVAINTGSPFVSVASAQPTTPGPEPEEKEHGISQKAIEVARVGNFPITNSMILCWTVSLGLILFAQLATRKMQDVPSGAQNFLEWLVEGLHNFLAGIIGPDLVDKTFWFLPRSSFSFSPPIGWASFQE